MSDDLSCNTESRESSRTEGPLEMEKETGKYCQSLNWDLFGPITHAWFWKRQQHKIALTSAEQMFEEQRSGDSCGSA